MGPRRVALLLVTFVALVTSGLGVTAARAASSSATSSQKICVALVVDGRSLGSNVSTACAKVSKGSTGVDVLEAAGHRLTFRNDGLLCAIDGLPRSGCSAVDDTHYWAYFHRAPGSTSWVYSSDNESTYQPADDSTEGWAYRDGKLLKPAAVAYSTICKPEPKSTPSASRHPSAKPTHSAAALPSTNRRHGSAVANSPSSSASPSLASHDPPGRHRPGKTHHHGTVEDTTQSVVTHTAQPSRSPSNAALVGGSPPSSSGNHSWLAIVIGLVVVVALGGLAALRFRRSE